jgi:DNA-binding winged helix-turn-helix (wHTH) protein/tetratricopeptide (TPR) repeat protein
METVSHRFRALRFGIFDLDACAGELRKHGIRVHLQDQPFQILMLLLSRPGELVSRDEIRQKLWSADTFVDFDRNLNKAMNKLRLALGDSAESPKFIETLHRRGYRFIAPIQILDDSVGKTVRPIVLPYPDRRKAQSVPVMAPSAIIPRRRLWWWYVAALCALLATVFLVRSYTAQGIASKVTPRRSIAVLGFKNLSGRADQAWLSIALSDWMATELSAGEQLRTIPAESVARMAIELSLRDEDSPGRDSLIRIGKDLGTDLVVVGSYASLGKDAGDRVRLDLRLEDTKTGERIAAFSETGTESHLFDLVAQAGARLRSKLGIEAVTLKEAAEIQVALPADHEAARLYSEGLAKLRLFDALAARHLMEQSIAADPNFALSHSALATAWSSLGHDEDANAEAKRAFELSSNLSRQDRLLIEGRFYETSRNWSKAVEIYRTLFQFYPDNSDYGLALANAQISRGTGAEALETVVALKNLPAPLGYDARIDIIEGRAAESVGDFRRDLAATSHAVTKAQEVGASLLAAQALADEGWALINLGRVADVPVAIEQAKNIFLTAGDQRGLARAENLRGIVLQSQGDAIAAKRQYEIGLSIYRKIGNRKGVADELDNLGDVLFALGDLKGSRQSYERSLSANEEIGNEDGIALAKGALGPVLLALGEHEAAKRTSQESLEICRRVGDRSKAAIALAGLGSAFRVEGNILNAREYGTQAVSIFNEIGDKQSSARFQLLLAELFLDQGDNAAAAILARQSAAEFEREKAIRDMALAYAVLSRSLLGQREFAAGRSALDVATSLSGKYTDRNVELFVALSAAMIHIDSGRREDLVEAGRALNAFVADANKLGFAEYEIEGRLALAKLEFTNGTDTGGARLESVRGDAEQRGFGLIAQNARALLKSESRKVPHSILQNAKN